MLGSSDGEHGLFAAPKVVWLVSLRPTPSPLLQTPEGACRGLGGEISRLRSSRGTSKHHESLVAALRAEWHAAESEGSAGGTPILYLRAIARDRSDPEPHLPVGYRMLHASLTHAGALNDCQTVNPACLVHLTICWNSPSHPEDAAAERATRAATSAHNSPRVPLLLSSYAPPCLVYLVNVPPPRPKRLLADCGESIQARAVMVFSCS